MPTGNIDPRTDTFTLTSMRLGNEEYPSTIQNAEAENDGYLLYRPLPCHQWLDLTGTFSTGSLTRTAGMVYVPATASYDTEIYIEADSDTSSTSQVWLSVDGTLISSAHDFTSAGTTIIESFAGVSLIKGWCAVTISVTAGLGDETYIDRAASVLKQYTIS